MTPEGRIKVQVDHVLAMYEGDVWVFKPVQTGYGKRALDYLGCVKGHTFAIETKRPGKEATLMQRACARDIHNAGGTVWFISESATVELFRQWLEAR
jgi:hypothetical protein